MGGRREEGLRLIPHPAVTLVVVFGGTIAVQDGTGRQHQGSFVTGLGFGESLRALRAEDFQCLQVRLSPLAAHAVLRPPWPTWAARW